VLRFRSLAVAGATALGLSCALVVGPLSPASAASAAADPSIGTQVLNMLCTARAGEPVYTPFTISRCQEARTKDGFEVEQLICEGLLGGTFRTVISASRTNWFCFHGPITP
jgi:hypothetical protein